MATKRKQLEAQGWKFTPVMKVHRGTDYPKEWIVTPPSGHHTQSRHKNPNSNTSNKDTKYQFIKDGQDHPSEGHHRAQEQEYWRWYVSSERGKNRFNVIALFLSALALAGAGWSAVESSLQVAASQEANRMNAESGRAWLGPVDASFDKTPVIGSPLKITVNYQNSGHEPATGIVTDIESFVYKVIPAIDAVFADTINSYDASCKTVQPSPEGRVAMPTGQASLLYKVTKTLDSSLIDNTIKSGTKSFTIYGCISYTASNKTRHSYYCFSTCHR